MREIINYNSKSGNEKTFDERYGQEQPADFNNYNWVGYNVEFTVDATQPYTLEFDEMPGSSGEVYFYALRSDGAGNGAILSDVKEDPYILAAKDTVTYSELKQWRKIAYVVVRYPKAQTPENTTIINEIKVTAKGIDEKDAASVKMAEVTSVWQDYTWTYPNDDLSITKRTGTSANSTAIGERTLALYQANKTLGKDTVITNGSYTFSLTGRYRGNSNVVDGGTYTMQIVDDYIYAKTPTTSYVRLGPDDYYISGLYIGAMQQKSDSAGGTLNQYGTNLSGTIKIYAMTKTSPNTWVDAGTVSKENLSDRTTQLWNVWGDVSDSIKSQGIYRIKVEFAGIDTYNCEMGIGPIYTLRNTSAIMQGYLTAGAEEVTLSNNGGIIGLDKDGNQFAQPNVGDYSNVLPEDIAVLDQSVYGHYVQRANAELTITGIAWNTEANKSVALNNDADNNRVTQDWSLRGVEFINMRGVSSGLIDEEVAVLREAGITIDREDAVLYDLLPAGCFFDPDIAPTAWLPGRGDDQLRPAIMQSYQVVDNYKGTGRQLVIFHVATPTDADNGSYVSRGYEITRFETGFTVKFRSYYKWADYNTANNSENYMAYQISDELWGGNGFADEGLGANAPTISDVPTTNSVQAFYNLAGKGSVNTGLKNTIYAKVLQSTGISVSTETGAHKLVKADADILANFEKSAMVEVDGTYTYQITVQNKESSVMKDVVIFDRLENAAIDRATAESGAFDVDYWRGELVDINVFAAQTKGIAPEIYYSTSQNAAYDLTDAASGWTTQKPANLATVKAIAVDLSKKADSSAFEFESLEGTNIKITMKAPSAMPANGIYAYNNPAYYSTSIPTVGSPSSSLVEGDSVKVKLYEVAEFTVQKTVTGTGAPAGDSFEFVVEMNDEPYAKKEYTVYTGGVESAKGYTTSEGKMTLLHNQKAVFSDAVAGDVYKVTETAKTGYTTTPASGEITGTLAKLGEGENLAAFTNKYGANETSLTVQKTVSTENGQTAPATDEFEFILKIDSSSLAGKAYRLFTGSIEQSGSYETDTEGKFKLKDGQKAVFEGLEVDKGYEVTEVAKTDYEVTAPANGKATGTLSAAAATAAFTNKYAPKSTLTIQKTVTGAGAPATDTFEFTVKVGSAAYASKPYIHYEAGGTTMPKTTTADGKLTLKAGEKAVFEGLAVGAAYEVAETTQEHYEQTAPANNGAAIGSILGAGSLASFANQYAPKASDIEVIKTSNKMFDNTKTEAISNVVKAGDEITYTLKVTNNGNKDAKNVTLRDYIPEETTYKADSVTGNGAYITANGKEYLHWNIASVQKQTSIEVSFTVIVNVAPEGESAKSIKNVGYFDNGNENPVDSKKPEDPTNPTNELKNPVIEIVKEASPSGKVNEGDVITYTIKVKVSEGGAKDVEISDVLPQGLSLVKDSISYTPVGGTNTSVGCKYENGTVSWPKVDLLIGESTFTFKAMVDILPDSVKTLEIKNVAAVKVPNKEIDPYESTESVVTVEGRSANISKTAVLIANGVAGTEQRGTDAAPIEAMRSQIVEYRITVVGDGATGLKSGNIEVVDPIPSGTIFVEGSITATLQDAVASSTAEIISKELTADGVKWVIKGLDDGEKAYLTFRVKAPKTTDDPATTNVQETSKTFSNTAKLLDVAMEESVHTTTVTTVDKQGSETTYTLNDTIYKEEAYKKDSETTYHIVKAPLVELTKTSNPESSALNGLIPCVKEGDEIEYTLTLVNNGATVAEKVHVSDMIPEHTTYVKNSITGNGTYSETENRIDWEIDNLAVGNANKVVLSFKVTVNAVTDENCGVIRNVAHSYVPHPDEITANEPLPSLEEYTPSNAQEHQTNTFVKTANPVGGVDAQNAVKVAEGQVITYTMQFNATGEVEDVIVKDTIPEGLTLVPGSIEIIDTTGSVQIVSDSAYENTSRTITWPTQSSVQTGVTGFRFKVTVDRLAIVGEKLFQNQAIMTYNPGDGSSMEEESNMVVHQAQRGEASISKTAALVVNNTLAQEDKGHSTAPVEVKRGQVVEYRLKVQNNGAKSGLLAIADALPEGTTLVNGSIKAEIKNAVSGSTAEIVSMNAGQVITPDGLTKNGVAWEVKGLAEGEMAILTFRVYAPLTADDPTTAAREYEKVFTNIAMVTDKEKETLLYEEDTMLNSKGEQVFAKEEIVKVSETTHHIVKDTGLSAEKSTDHTNGATVKAGERITYTIRVSNNGKAIAENVVIRDMVPEYTTYVAGSAICSVSGIEAKAVVANNQDGLLWVIPEIPVDGVVEVKFRVTVDKMDQAGTRVIKNVAQYTELSPGEDPSKPEDNEYDNSNPVENTKIGTPSKNTDNAKTGDSNKLMEIIVILAVAIAMAVGIFILKASKQKKTNK